MSEQDPEFEAFSKFIVALEPWLSEVEDGHIVCIVSIPARGSSTIFR
jgi:hypothetical protein